MFDDMKIGWGGMRAKPGTYVCFRLGEEVFAVEVTRAREILDVTLVVQEPRMTEAMCGVIDLRGAAVPVVDLRVRSGMGSPPDERRHRVVILEVMVAGRACVVGALVDAVQEVIELEQGQLGPGPRLDAVWLQAIAQHRDLFVMTLDPDAVVGADQPALFGPEADLALR